MIGVASPRILGGGGRGESRTPRSSAPAQPDQAGGKPRRVLIVEDNWLVAVETEAALLEAGFEVLGIAVTAEEAVRICGAEHPDLVLMDIRLLGQRDGVEAAIEIRSSFDIPAVFVSAHDDPDTRSRAQLARPLGWIAKPVDSHRLVERLQHLLQRPN